ncbi:trypsin-like peptidase domain-containing protein [Colwellia sp. D2M02]|uniref:Outer membrane-stress sensor serine endopeptidase DegS n=1 Tax=Colwellia asteriadis TaxID=517723 RepID=A0ABN1L315_9GAMM|nr:trypsin-like peptidase domain-containing protein [Colwellia sp. D2M02]MBU2893626.1 trypsin-like peptidase domain-containing protein [Colwellia sp. D2M02]
MKLFSLLKYILSGISYGVALAVLLLILFPSIAPGLHSSAFISTFFKSDNSEQAPLSFAKAVSIASPSVVNIYSEKIEVNPRYGRQARKSTRLGSGVIMDARGFILTNLHVIQQADLIKVVLQDGQLLPAELIGFDQHTDLAVLRVNADNLPVIAQKPNQSSLAGDIVLAIGNPLNLGQTVTQGIISATGRNGLSNTSYLEFLQMDAAINEGNSGGALINSNGILVGINSRKFTQSDPQLNIQGIFFAVPYQLAYKVMRQIIENGKVVRGWLGISVDNYRVDIGGFVIGEVIENGPADIANIKAGDIVYQIGNQPIHSINQALDIIAETPPNTDLVFKIYRHSKAIEVVVTILEFKG